MFKKIKSFDAALDKVITKGAAFLGKNFTFTRIMLTIYFISLIFSLFVFLTPIGLIMAISSLPTLNPPASQGAGMFIILTIFFAAAFTIIGTLVFIGKFFVYIFSKLNNGDQ